MSSSINFIINTNGELYGCGSYSPYGVGDDISELTKLKKRSNESNWKYVTSNSENSFFINKNNELFCCGKNEFFECGIGNKNIVSKITKVNNDEDWLMVASMYKTTYAIKRDGTLWVAGYDITKKPNTICATFTKVGNDTDWKYLQCCEGNVLALKRNGTLYAWGNNYYGQLGTGFTRKEVLTPKIINEDKDWKKICMQQTHSILLKNDGSVWSCGLNSSGQSMNDSSLLKKIIDNCKDISITNKSTSVIKNDGRLFFIGSSGNNELPYIVNSIYWGFTEQNIKKELRFKKIFSFNNFCIYVDINNDCYIYGNNSYGQLGIGTTGEVKQFIKIPEDIGKVKTSINSFGYEINFLIKKDEEFYKVDNNALNIVKPENINRINNGNFLNNINKIKKNIKNKKQKVNKNKLIRMEAK